MEPLAKHILEKSLPDNGRIFATRTQTKDIVTIQGSVLGGELMLAEAKRRAPYLAARLFDAGTKTQTKDALREALAARGASISFSGGEDRTYFYGTCLPEDLAFVVSIIGECLSQPIFPAGRFSRGKDTYAR